MADREPTAESEKREPTLARRDGQSASGARAESATPCNVEQSVSVSLRARFPDGKMQAIHMDAHAPFSQLLHRLRAAAGWTHLPTVRAGIPPRVVDPARDAAVAHVLGTAPVALVVEPAGGERAPRARGGGSTGGGGRARGRAAATRTATGRARASGSGRGRGRTTGTRGGGDVVTLADVGRARRRARGADDAGVDADDANDADWRAGDAGDESDGAGEARPAAKRARPARRTRGAAGHDVLAGMRDAAAQALVGAAATAGDGGVEHEHGKEMGTETEERREEEGLFGPDGSVADVDRASGVVSRDFHALLRGDLRGALRGREREALGERRLAALHSGQYELVDEGALKFRVTFRGLDKRKSWDGPMMKWPRTVVAAVVRHVVKSDAKNRLRELDMAICSPRMFWNVARLFPRADVHAALAQLLPDEDRAFLRVRDRRLTAKARRNAQNKADMGWTSD